MHFAGKAETGGVRVPQPGGSKCRRRRSRRRRSRRRSRRRRSPRSRRRTGPRLPVGGIGITEAAEGTAEHRADEQAGQQPGAEEAAGPGREGRTSLPVGHRTPADGHLAHVRLDPVGHGLGVGGAGRHLEAAGRRPLHVGHRRPVPGIEEARRPALGQGWFDSRALAAVIAQRPSSSNEVTRSMSCGRRTEVEGPPRLLVALDGDAVVRLGLRVDARHFHIEVERADVVGAIRSSRAASLTSAVSAFTAGCAGAGSARKVPAAPPSTSSTTGNPPPPPSPGASAEPPTSARASPSRRTKSSARRRAGVALGRQGVARSSPALWQHTASAPARKGHRSRRRMSPAHPPTGQAPGAPRSDHPASSAAEPGSTAM